MMSGDLPSENLIFGVTLGTRVEVELLDEHGGVERLAFDIVPDAQADFAAGFLGVGATLARALLGRRAGDVVQYRLADVVQARIVSVAPSVRPARPDHSAARQAAIQEAVSRSDREDMVRLALTVDVKWGDWDPERVAETWDEH
jgi:hypothetical protein